MQNVTCILKDSALLGTPCRRTQSCPPETRKIEVDYLNEDHKGALPAKVDNKTYIDFDGTMADLVSLGSLLDADETTSQDQGKASSGFSTPGQQGSRLMTPRMSGSTYHQHHHQ